jgi:hypothetical protein
MDAKQPMVYGTASATLRQLTVHVFDKVVIEDGKLEDQGVFIFIVSQ